MSSADADAFYASDDPSVPTVVFLHGNGAKANEAVSKAYYVYALIRAQTDRPFRFVVWSWPAERMLRHIRDDVNLKAEYSDVESHYMALWLHRMRPDVKVCLIGHSLGARIITGSLHLLGGGDVACQALPQETTADWIDGKRNPVRIVLLAAAIDSNWLGPNGRHCCAMSVADQALITRNPCDRVLRWYSLLHERGESSAVGNVGLCGITEPDKVDLVDVQCSVGKSHDWRNYSSSPEVCNVLTHFAFLDDVLTSP